VYLIYNQLMENLTTYINDQNIKNILSNQYVLGFLTLILILYGSLAQQTLPKFMYNLFDNSLFIFLILLAITIIGTQDWYVAFLVALIFGVVMHRLNQTKIKETFESQLNM
jgi:hypothetical protein